MAVPLASRSGNSTALARIVFLFTVEALLLLAVVLLGYFGLGRLRAGQEELAATLPKATVSAEVLHYSDVLRVIHVSLIGAGRNAAYVDERLKRLGEIESQLEASLVRMESMTWAPEERVKVDKIVEGMRSYAGAFPPVLEKARRATPDELPELIQANTALRRDAYNMLLEMLPRIQAKAGGVLRVDSVASHKSQRNMLGGLGVAMVLGLWIFAALVIQSRRTRAQAEELNGSMEALSGGDLSRTCRVITRDELGRVGENLNRIFELLAHNIRTIINISGKLRSVAEVVGTRSRSVIERGESERAAIDGTYVSLDRLNGGIRTISGSVDTLSSSSEQTSSSIHEMAASMETISHHTDSLFASVEQTASATEEMVSSFREVDRNIDFLRGFVTDTSASMVEMNASIGEVDRHASRSYDLALHVSEAAESGMKAVSETMAGMQQIRESVHEANGVVSRLGERSTEIGRIINVIDEVARQTNLLALNASILAAQAGVHGKGFSVVAIEIRDLAERTASSTREIGLLVHSVQEEVQHALEAMGAGASSVDGGVALANEAGRALTRILESAKKSLEMGRGIADSMKEQARGIDDLAKSIERVNDMVGQVSAATNQQAAGSEFILAAIEQMREVARSVRQATVEQKIASATISTAAENMMDMVREISSATSGQASESGKIVETVRQVREIAEGNRGSAGEMTQSVDLLADAIRELDDEIRKFKVRA